MSTPQELTEEQRNVIQKVERLLRLAGSTQFEAEAASAANKAQELLAAYNLDRSALGEDADSAARGQEQTAGGFYDFQKGLYRALAELNFCLYWNQKNWVERPLGQQNDAVRRALKSDWNRKYRRVSQHILVGKGVNVLVTKQMAVYLFQTIERLTRAYLLERCGECTGGLLRGRQATSFREGVAERLVSKIYAKRREMLLEEERKQRDAAERARAAGTANTHNAVTLSTLRQSERDANMDHLYGEGWSARQRAEKAERRRKLREAEQAYEHWARENPKEAAEEAKRRAAEERRWRNRGPGSRGGQGRTKDRDWSAYEAGSEAGRNVGLDPQAGQTRPSGLLN